MIMIYRDIDPSALARSVRSMGVGPAIDAQDLPAGISREAAWDWARGYQQAHPTRTVMLRKSADGSV